VYRLSSVILEVQLWTFIPKFLDILLVPALTSHVVEMFYAVTRGYEKLQCSTSIPTTPSSTMVDPTFARSQPGPGVDAPTWKLA
jgi:hypothetical protein